MMTKVVIILIKNSLVFSNREFGCVYKNYTINLLEVYML